MSKCEASEAQQQVDGDNEPEKTRSKGLRIGDPIAFAALLLSVVIALINAYYVVRHAEVVAQPPDEVLLYLDSGGRSEYSKAVPILSVRLVMTNMAANDHGDMIRHIDASINQGAVFENSGIGEALFVANSDEIDCELRIRCVRLNGLIFLEESEGLYDLPGGFSNSRYFSFPILGYNCQSDDDVCNKFETKADVVEMLSSGADIQINVDLVSDGSREITCKMSRFDPDVLETNGWLAVPCSDGKSTGKPWL